VSNATFIAAPRALTSEISVGHAARPDSRRAPRGSAIRGLLSGAAFLAIRAPIYAGVAILAAVACLIGVLLFAVQAGARRLVGDTEIAPAPIASVSQASPAGNIHG